MKDRSDRRKGPKPHGSYRITMICGVRYLVCGQHYAGWLMDKDEKPRKRCVPCEAAAQRRGNEEESSK